jgi:DNA-binding response OmpR family regulator
MVKLPRLLVLEDEPIIALDLEDTLSRGGFQDVTVLRSCYDAFGFLKHTRPDAALLDINLVDGMCHEVAELLCQMSVPFVVYSGLEDDQTLQIDMFRGAKWLLKPASPDDLLKAIGVLIGYSGPKA